MPEHRDGTPDGLRLLESFLWHDLDAAGWPDWVARKLPGRGAGSVERALRLHAALRAMRGGLDGDATAALNRLVGEAGIVPEVGAGGGVALRAAGPDEPVSMLLLDALSAMADGSWRRFRRCDDPGCRASFYDSSRGGAQRWCSMAGCGSRNKMRRFRARSTGTGAAATAAGS